VGEHSYFHTTGRGGREAIEDVSSEVVNMERHKHGHRRCSQGEGYD